MAALQHLTQPHAGTAWVLRAQAKGLQAPPAGEFVRLARALGVSEALVELMWLRGLEDAEAMDAFLDPGLRRLAPPADYPGLTEAAELLGAELHAGKRVAVWGDYDVDGLTAAALVYETLTHHGHAPLVHIPDRAAEGYGLNIQGVEALAGQGAGVLVTVDCGITNAEAVARARELGMTVIVTDHHLPGEVLPPAHAMVNPRLAACPGPDLAGVGVAFLFMAAVNRLMPGRPRDMRESLDLVALGTIADVVKLWGQNRILAKNGLLKLTEAARPGILALKEVSGFAPRGELSAGHVGFSLAPRLNAAGRLAHARLGLDLLLAQDLETARPLAQELDALNARRRSEEDAMLREALEDAEVHATAPALVLARTDWNAGVAGIVASRVAERLGKPAVICCGEGEALYKGSGRSGPAWLGVDLHACLAACAEHLEGFGGHTQAAGLSLRADTLENFRTAFAQAVATALDGRDTSPTLLADRELGFGEVTFRLLKELEQLAPFGPGNPEPVFLSPALTVRSRRVFGGGHVKLDLHDPAAGVTLSAKAWRQAKELTPSVVGNAARMAYTARIDRYNGMADFDLTVKDLKLSPSL